MIRWRPFVLLRVGILAACGLSIAMVATPVARHMAGIVLLERQPTPRLPQEAPAGSVDITPILALAPFGRPAPVALASGTSDQTPPDLRLKGIFAATSEGSVAMLEVDGETALYRASQMVTDIYELTLIGADFVELSSPQKTITLYFDDAQITDTRPKEKPGEDLNARLLDQISANLVIPALYEKPAAPETTSEYIDYWRNRIRKNPQAVLDEIGLTPTRDGYVIASKHDVGVRLAGLKAGDLVRTVNGQQVGNLEDDRRFYDRVATSGQARLEIERGGKMLTLSFPLR